MSTSGGRPRQALLDTAAAYALADRRETAHDQARAISGRLIAQRWRLFTTNFILAEIHALFLTRLGRAAAVRVLDQLDQGPTTVIRVTDADEQRARVIIHQYTDKAFSFTDATSFAVMERLGLTSAFTFDRNFTQYGFTVLTPDQP